MRTYTPNAASWHTTTQIPEDLVDQRSASSIATPVEAALDNAAFVKRQTSGLALQSTTTGTAGSVVDQVVDSIATHTIEVGGNPVALTLNGNNGDDIVKVTATFACGTSVENAQVRIRIAYGAVSEVVHAMTVDGGAYTHVHLEGVHTIATGTNVTATITCEVVNAASPSTTTIFGQMAITAQRIRP